MTNSIELCNEMLQFNAHLNRVGDGISDQMVGTNKHNKKMKVGQPNADFLQITMHYFVYFGYTTAVKPLFQICFIRMRIHMHFVM